MPSRKRMWKVTKMMSRRIIFFFQLLRIGFDIIFEIEWRVSYQEYWYCNQLTKWKRHNHFPYCRVKDPERKEKKKMKMATQITETQYLKRNSLWLMLEFEKTNIKIWRTTKISSEIHFALDSIEMNGILFSIRFVLLRIIFSLVIFRVFPLLFFFIASYEWKIENDVIEEVSDLYVPLWGNIRWTYFFAPFYSLLFFFWFRYFFYHFNESYKCDYSMFDGLRRNLARNRKQFYSSRIIVLVVIY